jgi:hypothetical protein
MGLPTAAFSLVKIDQNPRASPWALLTVGGRLPTTGSVAGFVTGGVNVSEYVLSPSSCVACVPSRLLSWA